MSTGRIPASRVPAVVAGAALLLLAAAWSPIVIDVPPGRAWLFDGVLVIALDAALAAAGLALLVFRPDWRPVLLGAAAIAASLALLEATFRYLYAHLPGSIRLDDRLGWVTRANYRSVRNIPGFGEVRYSTGPLGFRRFGDTASTRFRLLIIGDSYTQNAGVSDGGTLSDHLAQNDSTLEVFAFGVGGYGSAQEYLVLDAVYDLVRPDLVIWQFCDNDLVNNDWWLESGSINNNNWLPRPYYEDGRFVTRFPSRFFPARYSRLARYAQSRLAILRRKAWDRLGVPYGYSFDDGGPDYERARATTSAILGLVARRTSGTPVVTFSCHERGDWIAPTFAGVAHDHGMQYLAGIDSPVLEAKARGIRVDGSPHDVHYNATGNAIAARVLLDSLRTNGLLAAQPRYGAAGRDAVGRGRQ